MIFRFNKAQLGVEKERKLNELLEAYQEAEEQEIEVIADEFPEKFTIKVGSDVVPVQWDQDSVDYKILASPEKPEPQPEPQPESDNADPDLLRARLLASNIFAECGALTPEERVVFWEEFSNFIMKVLKDAVS